MSEQKIPYKIYLSESEMPTTCYNVRADMKRVRCRKIGIMSVRI